MKTRQKDTTGILASLNVGFSSHDPLPQYYQLKQFLKTRILSGELKPNDRIPSANIMAERLKITRVTVDKALGELEQENLVRRVQGKGTFVNNAQTPLSSKEVVGLVFSTTGHLFQPFSASIIDGLTSHDYFCLPLNFDSMRKDLRVKLVSLLKKQPAKLIIDGLCSFPFTELKGYNGDIFFVIRHETENDSIPATRVLSDFHEGGRLAADHLLSLGFRKLFFHTGVGTLPPEVKTPRLPEGLLQAFRERGLPPENLVTVTDSENNSAEALDSILATERKPLAFFAEGDFRARNVYTAASRIGLRIPDDVMVIGYYNTPWCDMLDPKLSSISIREKEIARITVDKIVSNGKKERIMVKPELIVRQSCG